MTLDHSTETLVTAALDAVWSAAAQAKAAGDLEAAKAALNVVWNRVHDAQDLITRADNETRRAALAKLGEAHVFA